MMRNCFYDHLIVSYGIVFYYDYVILIVYMYIDPFCSVSMFVLYLLVFKPVQCLFHLSFFVLMVRVYCFRCEMYIEYLDNYEQYTRGLLTALQDIIIVVFVLDHCKFNDLLLYSISTLRSVKIDYLEGLKT